MGQTGILTIRMMCGMNAAKRRRVHGLHFPLGAVAILGLYAALNETNETKMRHCTYFIMIKDQH